MAEQASGRACRSRGRGGLCRFCGATTAEPAALERVEDAGGDLHRRGTRGRRHERLPPGPHRVEKIVVLGGDGVGLADGSLLEWQDVGEEPLTGRRPLGGGHPRRHERPVAHRRRRPHGRDRPGVEIDRHHAGGAPHRERAADRGVDPRRRQVGHESRCERQPRPRHVFVPPRGDEPAGLHPLEPSGFERQHEIDVVDHEVVHDADVERTVGERRHPRRLDERRPGGPRRHGPPGGIESLHVPHGDGATVSPRGDRDRPGILDGRGQRLLHEQVDAGGQERERNGGVEPGGRRHHGRVDESHELLRQRQSAAAVGLGHARPRPGHRIDHRHEFGIRPRGEQSGVDRPQVPAADHRRPQSRHAALLRSRARPWRPPDWRARKSSR
jgi:hypothetical protein